MAALGSQASQVYLTQTNKQINKPNIYVWEFIFKYLFSLILEYAAKELLHVSQPRSTYELRMQCYMRTGFIFKNYLITRIKNVRKIILLTNLLLETGWENKINFIIENK